LATGAEFSHYVTELLEPLGQIGVRRMFGGVGVYAGSTMFGLISDDTLYFKVNDGTRPAYEAAGSTPFQFTVKTGRTVLTSYWRVPDSLFDGDGDIVAWATDALGAARSSQAKKPAPRKTTSRRKRA
jgi:DNA transformation protein